MAAGQNEGDAASAKKTDGSQTVSLDRITSSKAEEPSILGNQTASREAAFLSHHADQFKKELGWLGVPFGGRTEKPGNISALVISACIIFILGMYITERTLTVKYGKEAGDFQFDRTFTTLTSIITLILGYLFGSNDRSGKND